jgi:hypothetical protein
MSYYDMYFIVYDGMLFDEFFPTDEIISLFGGASDEVRTNIESLLNDTLECGFNNGFRFAMDIFSNRLRDC